jgi:hypothetical protein
LDYPSTWWRNSTSFLASFSLKSGDETNGGSAAENLLICFRGVLGIYSWLDQRQRENDIFYAETLEAASSGGWTARRNP